MRRTGNAPSMLPARAAFSRSCRRSGSPRRQDFLPLLAYIPRPCRWQRPSSTGLFRWSMTESTGGFPLSVWHGLTGLAGKANHHPRAGESPGDGASGLRQHEGGAEASPPSQLPPSRGKASFSTFITHRLSAESISQSGMDSQVLPANDNERRGVMLNLIRHDTLKLYGNGSRSPLGLRQGRPAAAHVCAEPSEADASRPAIEG